MRFNLKLDKKNESGFSLIEVAVSLVIFSVFSLYMASSLVQSSTDSEITNQKLTALYLANLTLKHYQAQDYTSQLLPLQGQGEQPVALQTVLPPDYHTTNDLSLFSITIAVTADNDPQVADSMADIHTAVSWQGKQVRLNGTAIQDGSE